MAKYVVEASIYDSVEVEADSIKEAIQIARSELKYNGSEDWYIEDVVEVEDN